MIQPSRACCFVATLIAVTILTACGQDQGSSAPVAAAAARTIEVFGELIALGIDPAEPGHPATIQDRAYSSPIWYDPR